MLGASKLCPYVLPLNERWLNTNQSSTFFQVLPPEVRYRIYGYLYTPALSKESFAQQSTAEPIYADCTKTNGPVMIGQMHRVNRQAHREIRDMLLRRHESYLFRLDRNFHYSSLKHQAFQVPNLQSIYILHVPTREPITWAMLAAALMRTMGICNERAGFSNIKIITIEIREAPERRLPTMTRIPARRQFLFEKQSFDYGSRILINLNRELSLQLDKPLVDFDARLRTKQNFEKSWVAMWKHWRRYQQRARAKMEHW